MNNQITSNADKHIEFKGLDDFLLEDSSLTEKMSLEEFNKNGSAPDNSDETIEAAYRSYRSFVDKFN